VIATDFAVLLIPLWIILGLGVIVLVLGILGRIQNGRYLRPVLTFLAKVPLFRRWLEKGSRAMIERQNPELASAMRKLEPHAKHMHDPVQAQKAMSRLTREERAALLEVQDQQGGPAAEATNRQMRRQLEKQRKRR
jgi:hypothetical protein